MTYNELVDKHQHSQEVFADFGWHSLIWAKSAEPSFKPRRKIINHAFYASKLKAMSDIIFKAINNRILEWPTVFSNGVIDLPKEL